MRFLRAWCLTAIAVAALATGARAQSGVAWETDLAVAQRKAADSNRLVLLHVGATWCPPCQRLERNVFSQPGFGRDLATKYVAVKLDYDEHTALVQKLGVQAIPTDIVMRPNGDVVERVQSPAAADRYVSTMMQIAQGQAPAAGAPATVAAAQPQTPAAQTQSPPQQTMSAPNTPWTPVAPQPVVAQAPTAQSVSQQQVSAPQVVAPPLTPTTPPPVAHVEPARLAEQPPVVQPPPSEQPSVAQQDLPPGSPPLALDGYCPVTLVQKSNWQPGDTQWGAVHRGRTYLFIGPDEQRAFLADPDAYSPVLAGNDPVLALDAERQVPGRREFGLFVEKRVYLFSGPESRQKFLDDPMRYVSIGEQAMRESNNPTRSQ